MKCPYCGNDMTSGVVQSARQIFFTVRAHKFFFVHNEANSEVLLCFDNWIKPSCIAYHCAECKKSTYRLFKRSLNEFQLFGEKLVQKTFCIMQQIMAINHIICTIG